MTPRPFWILVLALPASAIAEQVTAPRDSYPALSPDGRELVFQSNRSGHNELWITNADGTAARQLTRSGATHAAETPVWSPDGRWIAFARYESEGNNDVFLLRPDGRDLRQLTNSPGYDGHPHWSADGKRIVFNSDRSSPDLTRPWGERWHEIHSMRIDGSDVRQHTRCQAVCTYGSLSPDGERLLYRRVIAEPGLNWALAATARNSEIVIADADGANERIIATSPAFDGWPVWSPDGRWIAFASNRAGPARTGQVWLVRPDGTALKQLTEGPLSHVQPSWAADGTSVWIYRSHESADVEFGGIARIPVTPVDPD